MGCEGEGAWVRDAEAACAGGCEELEAGAAVDQASNDGCTPLWIAAQNGHGRRARKLLAAGADAVMLHYKSKDPADYFELTRRYAELDPKVPLVVVPSTFSHVPESELQAAGANIVIYANHLLRSAYPAMVHTAETILRGGRAHEVEEQCLSIKDVLALIPGV